MVWIVVALVSAGCTQSVPQSRYSRDGKTYGVVSGTFRHRWWNFYERGLSFAEGQYYQEAISDLQAALGVRGEDQRMARTYGMHFMDYFPHRELGIVYLEIDDLENAEYHLERSIRQWPTAKARYYLDQVRRQMIRRRGGKIAPPNIRIDGFEAEIRTRQDPVPLSGTIADEKYVSAVRIADRDLFLESARKEFSFTEMLDLSPGTHRIAVVAQNLGGQSARRELVFYVDRQGPLITVEEAGAAEQTGGNRVRLRGSVYDPAGIASLSVNAKKLKAAGGTEIFFDETLPFSNQLLKLSAEDSLANRTTVEFSPESVRTHGGHLHWLACRDALDSGAFAFLGAADKQAPTVVLKGWKPSQVVYVESIYLEGSVVDASEITRVTINGVGVHRREGRMIAFGRMVRLAVGSNRFTVTAEDKHGNTATYAIEVVRRMPEALQLAQRLSLTVLPFKQKGAVSDLALSFQDHLTGALLNRNRFRVVERNLLDTILREQNFSQSALVEPGTALKLGRLAAAHSIVTGSIVESRNGIETIARMIDVESSEILVTEDAYSESHDWAAKQNMAEVLATKIHRQFPLVSGIILEKKGNVIFTDLGQEQIGCQKRLVIFREHPVRHPLSDQLVGSDMEILSHARVQQVTPNMTKAELVEPAKEEVTDLDRVITQ